MTTSHYAVMLPDGRSDYECFVSDIRNDFELRVETIQKSAEENTKAYEVYCSELKAQLQSSLTENMRLTNTCADLRHQLAESEKERIKLKERVKELRKVETELIKHGSLSANERSVVTMFSSLTCLTISNTLRDNDKVTHTCSVTDGNIKGHKFTLSVNESTLEYTYTPVSTPPINDQRFNSTMCFPDYMIGRFLMNLLQTTYLDST